MERKKIDHGKLFLIGNLRFSVFKTRKYNLLKVKQLL